ncbi:MAG: HAD-IIIC family phosphatase [Granulosicoccus sp.]|nr:HAD-IIIC family phosphatase [Granulosicoccus sp.]
MKHCQITILSAANWDILAPVIEGQLRELTGIDTSINTPAFGQYPLLIRNTHSALYELPQDYWVFAERLEDFLPAFAFYLVDEAAVWDRFQEYLALLRLARSNLSGHMIIHAIDHTRRIYPADTPGETNGQSIAKLLTRMNGTLQELCTHLEDTSYLPVERVIERIGRDHADPGKYYLLGRSPYSQAFAMAYGAHLAGHLLSVTERTVRALVLDLDNTLWGGNIGDDGLAGIDLGQDYPGNQYLAVQQFIKSLQRRGIVLTLCSKNEDSIASTAISQHPDMILRNEDFVDKRINWAPKSRNIRELSTALRLGLSSMLVIDDNPVERHEIRTNCPGVLVPDLPQDVSEWPQFLAALPGLYKDDSTATDTAKSEKYQLMRTLDTLEHEAPTREAFLESLAMTLAIGPMTQSTQKRALQLFTKTNQFNTTTRRYAEADIRKLIAAGARIYTVRLRDRYGSDEIIAVTTTEAGPSGELVITSLVMSCRVMGRDVETGILAFLCEQAIAEGHSALVGEIICNERNSPCHQLYENHGFARTDETHFRLALPGHRIARPTWFRYEIVGHISQVA